MKQSLPGLFRNTEAALRRSPDDYACVMAYSLGALVDHLRDLKEGTCTMEEFFDFYVFDSERRNLADSVDKRKFLCMQDDLEDEAAE